MTEPITAVGWLLFELSKNGLLPDGIPSDIHNKAKEMEKENIKKGWLQDRDITFGDWQQEFEQWYNETFKSE